MRVLIALCLLFISSFASEAAFDVVSSETKEAMAHLKQQKKELVGRRCLHEDC